jgi:hypothetical protein
MTVSRSIAEMTGPRAQAMDFLRSRSADTVSHLNGTLLEHLVATEGLLRSWGAPEAVGPEVEGIVYLYASCDRSVVYPQLSGDGPGAFRDRFRRQTFEPTDAQLRDVADLTLANELEITLSVSGRAAGASGHPPWIGPFVEQVQTRASAAVRHAAQRLLVTAP